MALVLEIGFTTTYSQTPSGDGSSSESDVRSRLRAAFTGSTRCSLSVSNRFSPG